MKNEKQKRILRSEKKILLLGIGTSKNPIKLVPENTSRTLMKKHSTIPVNEKTELHKLKEEYVYNVFLLNVISNPHLSKDEYRLAIYFLQRKRSI